MAKWAQYLLVVQAAISGAGATIACAAPLNATCEYDATTFAAITFDYLIIGGGTAGLTLSARLSEDPAVTVGVIEAGALHLDDEVVNLPVFSPVGNASFDWLFVSTPQRNIGDRTIALPRGKMLGGSSAINGLAWGRASTSEYNALDAFAPDQGWTWKGLLPFMKKAETLSQLTHNPYPGIGATEAHRARQSQLRDNGFSGPITATYVTRYLNASFVLAKTMNDIGIMTNAAPLSGNVTGVFNIFHSFDRRRGVRSYSAPTYFCSSSHRKNQVILANAQATRILFSNSGAGLTATGVQFSADGRIFSVQARREVILSAGAVQTPQLLELSGVGNASLLQSYGIETLLDLPAVGENLQEHLFAPVQWRVKPGVETFDILRNNATFAAEEQDLYDKTHTGLLTASQSTQAFLPLTNFVTESRMRELIDTFDNEAKKRSRLPIESLQHPLLKNWLQKGRITLTEIIQLNKGLIAPAPNESYVALLGGILHPASRGSVHIVSSNPLKPPTIDPNFLDFDFDIQVLLDVVKFMIALGNTPPFVDLVDVQTSPDPGVQTDEYLLEYIRQTVSAGDHLLGTAAMAPRNAGGVVDGRLKVYGTNNLRVVDASILPFQLSCHTQATVYGIAEKAADIIRGYHNVV